MTTSPYTNLLPDQWKSKTEELIAQHPLPSHQLIEIVHSAWVDIFHSGIGSKPFRIGVDIFPAPQILGFFLHELIALELEYRFPNSWRRGILSTEKDLIFVPDDTFSIEIKTSSSPRNIYGNRSYAQKSDASRKSKSGYYLAINFAKLTTLQSQPRLKHIRFGWIDQEDWIGQSAATGQQARLSPLVERNKLLELPLSE